MATTVPHLDTESEMPTPSLAGGLANVKLSPDEIRDILRNFRETVQAANPTGRDLLAELSAERRAAAAAGE